MSGICLLWVLGALQSLCLVQASLLQERRPMGNPFRAGLERSWVLS